MNNALFGLNEVGIPPEAFFGRHFRRTKICVPTYWSVANFILRYSERNFVVVNIVKYFPLRTRHLKCVEEKKLSIFLGPLLNTTLNLS